MKSKIILIFILLFTSKVFGAGDDWTGKRIYCDTFWSAELGYILAYRLTEELDITNIVPVTRDEAGTLGGQIFTFTSSSKFRRSTVVENKHELHYHYGTYKPYKDGRHMAFEYDNTLKILKGTDYEYDEGTMYSDKPESAYFDRQELGIKYGSGGSMTGILFKCQLLSEENASSVWDQLMSQQKKKFVEDPQKARENNKKKNKL